MENRFVIAYGTMEDRFVIAYDYDWILILLLCVWRESDDDKSC